MTRGALVFCNELDKRFIVVISKNGKSLVRGKDSKYRVIPNDKLAIVK